MGVYIKVTGNIVAEIAGTEVNDFMSVNGFFEYQGDIPKQPLDLLLWDDEKKEIVVNTELIKERLEEGITNSLKALETIHDNFLTNLIGEVSATEVSSWDFKFKLANDLVNGNDLSEEQEIYLTYAGIKSKKAKTTWQTKVLSKSIRTRSIQGAADGLRSTFKKTIKEVDHIDNFAKVLDEAKLEFNTQFEKLKDLV